MQRAASRSSMATGALAVVLTLGLLGACQGRTNIVLESRRALRQAVSEADSEVASYRQSWWSSVFGPDSEATDSARKASVAAKAAATVAQAAADAAHFEDENHIVAGKTLFEAETLLEKAENAVDVSAKQMDSIRDSFPAGAFGSDDEHTETLLELYQRVRETSGDSRKQWLAWASALLNGKFSRAELERGMNGAAADAEAEEEEDSVLAQREAGVDGLPGMLWLQGAASGEQARKQVEASTQREQVVPKSEGPEHPGLFWIDTVTARASATH